jgi:hypothetical protein
MEYDLKVEDLFVGCELLHRISGKICFVEGLGYDSSGRAFVIVHNVYYPLTAFRGIIATVEWANNLVSDDSGASVLEYVVSIEIIDSVRSKILVIEDTKCELYGCKYQHEVRSYFKVNWGFDVVSSEDYKNND